MASPPVTYVNSAAKRTIGRPAAEILGRTLEQLYPADVAAAYAENDQWALKVRQPVEAVEEAPPLEGHGSPSDHTSVATAIDQRL